MFLFESFLATEPPSHLFSTLLIDSGHYCLFQNIYTVLYVKRWSTFLFVGTYVHWLITLKAVHILLWAWFAQLISEAELPYSIAEAGRAGGNHSLALNCFLLWLQFTLPQISACWFSWSCVWCGRKRWSMVVIWVLRWWAMMDMCQ